MNELHLQKKYRAVGLTTNREETVEISKYRQVVNGPLASI